MKKEKAAPESVVASDPALNVQVVERLSETDKLNLDLAQSRRELALANAKATVTQSELAEAQYNNLILQYALRYHLKDGDRLNPDGTIVRV